MKDQLVTKTPEFSANWLLSEVGRQIAPLVEPRRDLVDDRRAAS